MLVGEIAFRLLGRYGLATTRKAAGRAGTMSRQRHRLIPIAVFLCGAAFLAIPGETAAAWQSVERVVATQQTQVLTFLNAPAAGAPIVEVPRLGIEVGGHVREAVVDTGSTGVVLSASAIPNVDRLPSLGPGTITYSSSGRIMVGRWVVTPLILTGRTGRVVIKPIPVLAVDDIACTASARHCAPEQHPTHVAMLGIGFGREHDHQPGGTPDHNPLLNLAIPGGSPRAYVITRFGIHVGYTGDGFITVKLSRDAAGRDWSAPSACIAVGQSEPACGTVLVDTGITGMFLTVPADRIPMSGGERSLPDRTPIVIDLSPHAPGRRTSYGFQAGETNDAAAPSSITLAGIGKRPPFVNTGVHLLNRFDYLYDADVGLVGYRPVSR